jgi:HAD superfamily hydrolase (TIGR01509 family)
MVKGIIFDLGGVLMHLDRRWREVDQIATGALVEFLELNGLAVGGDFQDMFAEARRRSWELAERTELEPGLQIVLQSALEPQLNDRVRDLLPQAVDAYFRVSEQYWVPNPEGLEVLEQLSARGWLLGAISNAEHDELIQCSVARLGFARYLDPVVTSARVKWRKPNPRIFQEVARAWGMDLSDMVMVGNAPWDDIAGAHAAGMRAILVEQGHVRLPRPMPNASSDAAAKPDATVASLTELAGVLARM